MKLQLIIICFMFGSVSKAQTLSCAFNCNTNLTVAQYNVDSVKYIKYGKTNPVNFKDVAYKPDMYNICNQEMISATTCFTNTDSLYYDLYYPSNYTNYSTCPLPVIIMFHGGAYVDCNGVYNAPNIKLICVTLATRGYIVANFEYRRGVLDDPSGGYYSAQRTLAFLRAFQDGRGSVRSIIKWQRDNHTGTEKYQIDTNNIFVGGASAGCAIAIHLAYYPTQAQANRVFKNALDYAGTINQDFYYGDTTINYFNKIKGLYLMWGNGFLPTSYISNPTSFFSGNSHLVPIIAFHGKNDNIAPYDQQAVNFSPNTMGHAAYYSESNCLPFHSGSYVPASATPADMYSFGSDKFYQFLIPARIPMEYYLDCTAGHGLEFNTDPYGYYGTLWGDTQTDLVSIYMATRAAIFFQAILTGIASVDASGNYSLGQSRFNDCKNTRYGCNAATMNCNTRTCQ